MIANFQRIARFRRPGVVVGSTTLTSLRFLAPRTFASAASAATSSQKRALNPEQLQGKPSPTETATTASSTLKAGSGSTATPVAGTKSTPPTPPPSTFPSSVAPGGTSTAAGGAGGSSTSSSSNLPLMGLAAGTLVAGGGAYYYMNRSPTSQKPTSTVVSQQEPQDSQPQKAEPATVVVNRDASSSSDVSPGESSSAEAIGHRVVSIAVPDKMKGGANKSSAGLVVPVVAHPKDGHRVTAITVQPPSQKQADSSTTITYAPSSSSPVDDSSMTQRALVQLQRATLEEANEAVVSAHQSLWSSVAHDMMGSTGVGGADSAIHSEDATHLRTKIAQLASELSERTKWEAIRLKEFLAMKEQETAQKYQEILQTQRLEFEDILARRLREQEHQLSTQFQQALAEKEAGVQTLLKTALETQQAEHERDKQTFEELKTAEITAQLEQDFGQKLEEYKAQVAQDLHQKVATLTSLSQKLASLESALAASKTSHQGSVKAHKLSAAALALSQKLETSQPAGTELLALQAAAGEKGVIPAALKTIPPAVYSLGVATLPELQARFEDVYKQCRRAALVPAGRPGLEGQLAGIVFASLKYPPSPDDPAPELQPDHPEYVLVRAKKHVQLGELELAVEQLEKLSGQVAFTAADWKTSALHRVTVEKALKVIKLECALVNESLVE